MKPQRTFGLLMLVAAIGLYGRTSTAVADATTQPQDANADPVVQSFVADNFRKTGDDIVQFQVKAYNGRVMWHVLGLRVASKPADKLLTPADKLNGIESRLWIEVSATAYQTDDGHGWSKWQDSNVLASGVVEKTTTGWNMSLTHDGVPFVIHRSLVVGFAQIGHESNWRFANTASMKEEAVKRGDELLFDDADDRQEQQVAAIRSFINRGVDVIVFSAIAKEGWEPTLMEAKHAHIPVVIVDRAANVDDSLYTTYLGYDSVAQGRAAATWLAEKTGGKANIVELEGMAGTDPAIDRKQGFDEEIVKHPNMKIIKSQSAEFSRAKGREVMEAILKSPDAGQITAVFAHNDDMAIGAIQAIEAAGKRPGKDIVVVSIDGVKDAFQAMKDGTLDCTVECSPEIGPEVFDLVEKVVAGEAVEKKILLQPKVFTKDQAAALIDQRKY